MTSPDEQPFAAFDFVPPTELDLVLATEVMGWTVKPLVEWREEYGKIWPYRADNELHALRWYMVDPEDAVASIVMWEQEGEGKWGPHPLGSLSQDLHFAEWLWKNKLGPGTTVHLADDGNWFVRSMILLSQQIYHCYECLGGDPNMATAVCRAAVRRVRQSESGRSVHDVAKADGVS